MTSTIDNGQHSENLFGNPSVEGSSHLTTVQEPREFLRCTYQSCTAKEEDKIFIGKGAKSAHKRHMDGHTKPHTCPYPDCSRHTRGFARRDNFNNHLKTHQNKKKHRHRPASSHSSPFRVLGAGISAGHRSLENMTSHQRGKVFSTLLKCIELGIVLEDENEEDEAGFDNDEETEEDGME
ncbi:hypothetical protein BDD12DRAFT_868612 [Trichophaea hybrida]|nr:hypothetical protein BDD12DRAFT_868612 [Trichophaea hybrida]